VGSVSRSWSLTWRTERIIATGGVGITSAQQRLHYEVMTPVWNVARPTCDPN
jgi:hypothetical protein